MAQAPEGSFNIPPPDAIFLRLLDGCISLWSPGAERVYGWPASEAIGRISHELLQTQFPVPRAEIERHVLERGEWHGRLLQRRRNGQPLATDSQWSLFRDRQGRAAGMLEVNADSHQRAAAEVRHKLRLTAGDLCAAGEDWQTVETELLNLIGQAGGWGWGEVWDLESGRGAGCLTWTAAAPVEQRRFLRPGEGLLGRAWETGRIQTEMTESGVSLALPITARGRVARILAWHGGPAASADELWLLLFEEFGHRYGLTRERIAAEQALRQSELKFRSLVEAAPDALVIVDESGRIVISNRMVTELLGYTHEELAGQPVEILLPSGLRPSHAAQRTAYSRNPKARAMGAGLDLYARRKNGTELPVEISLSPLRLESGLLVTAVMRDLTQQKRRQADAARRHTLALEQAQHLATLGEVAAGLAHEIKNPLAGMAAALEILHEQSSSEQRPIMAEVQQQIGRIRRIVEDLLHYARPRPPEFRALDLNATLRQAAQLVAHTAARRRVRVSFQAAPLPAVLHDEDQIQRMVLNLALNAVDAAPEGGTVEIRSSLLPHGMAGIDVQDNGPGIPPEALPQLFRPFYTTKGSHGTGLGLPQCLRIAQAHGGAIDVSTELGSGTTFTVRLPLPGPARPREDAADAGHEI
jgi:PAS domain S-box-containing protein